MLNPLIGTSSRILKTLGEDAQKVGQWFMDKIVPALIRFGSEFTTMLKPHVEWFSKFLENPLLPAIERFGKWIGESLPGAIDVLRPLVIGLVDLGLSVVELALDAIADVWTRYLEPAFISMGKWLEKATGGWKTLAEGANLLQ